MKKLITIITILFITTSSSAEIYTVERVIDGDTLKLTNGEEVQLIGIKATEDEKMGQEATDYVKKALLLEGKEILIEYDVQQKNKDGRTLAYVFWNTNLMVAGELSNPPIFFNETYREHEGTYWMMLNSTIIKAGFATPMTIPPNIKHADLFNELYEEAREQKRGLWE